MVTKDRRDEQIAQMLKDGLSFKKVAEVTKLTEGSVRQQMRKKYPDLYEELLGPKESRKGRPRHGDSPRPPKPKVVSKSWQESRERAKEIAECFFSDLDLTLEDVGQKYGVTRERVRQICNIVDSERYKERKDAKKRLKVTLKEPKPRRFCKVCGVELAPDRTVYCSYPHYEIGTLHLRYHIDEEYRFRQRGYAARWILENQEHFTDDDRYRDQQVRHAARVLDITVDTEDHGRWLTKGSKAMMAALECYRNNWPLFDLLPEQIQEQVKRVAAAEDERAVGLDELPDR